MSEGEGTGPPIRNPQAWLSMVMSLRWTQIDRSDITAVTKTRIHISPGTRCFIVSSAFLGFDSVPVHSVPRICTSEMTGEVTSYDQGRLN